MTNIFDLVDPEHHARAAGAGSDLVAKLHRALDLSCAELEATSQVGQMMTNAFSKHSRRMFETHSERARKLVNDMADMLDQFRDSQIDRHASLGCPFLWPGRFRTRRADGGCAAQAG